MKNSLPYTWKSYFTVQADYQLWANDRLFAALGALDVALLSSDQGLPFGSISGTVEQMLAESRLWLARLRGDSMIAVQPAAKPDWNRLIEMTQEEARTLQLWLEHCDDNFFEQQLTYPVAPDAAHSLWVRDALTHMMSCSTYHRGQISAIVARLGYRNLDMDYDRYKREITVYRQHLAAITPLLAG